MKIKKVICIAIIVIVSVVVLKLDRMGIDKSENVRVEHRNQWYIEKLFSEEEQNKLWTIKEEKIKIAIIDSGVYSEHKDLEKVNIKHYCTSSVDCNNNSDYEHATNICGIICGYPSDSNGVVGVSRNVEIISIDISDDDGEVMIEDVLEAFQYAIEQSVDVINISFVTENNYEQLEEIVNEAYEKGIVVVAAAGNDINAKITYPAAYDNVISVGAYAKNGDLLYSELNNTNYLPGENIVTISYENSNGYVSRTGTSFSTPIMTGIVANIMLEFDVDNKKIIDILTNSSNVILNYEQIKKLF